MQLSRRAFLRRSAWLAGGAAGSAWMASCDEFYGRIEQCPLPERVSGGVFDEDPNIVLIVADDLGWGDLGPYGGTAIPTPNLDGMGASGVWLSNFYVTDSLCTCSRASLLTGRYHIRTGLTQVLFPGAQSGLPRWEITIAELLRHQGYSTGMVGKWHLGDLPEYMPWSQGFDYFFGLPYSNDMTPLPLYRNQTVIEEPAQQDLLIDRFTTEAVGFIQRSRSRPFFLYMPHTAPHIPLFPPPRFQGVSGAGLYGDMVMALDWSVGQIVAALDVAGLRRKTLVVFLSDNGAAQDVGGSNGGLRGAKGSVWEGGIRVPFLANWPGQLPSNRQIDVPAGSIDLLPTIAAVVGIGLPSDRVIDGMDIWPVLKGESDRTHQDFYFFTGGRAVEGIRSGNWKLITASRENLRLYDLSTDRAETTSLSSQYPEVVTELLGRADTWAATVTTDDPNAPSCG